MTDRELFAVLAEGFARLRDSTPKTEQRERRRLAWKLVRENQFLNLALHLAMVSAPLLLKVDGRLMRAITHRERLNELAVRRFEERVAAAETAKTRPSVKRSRRRLRNHPRR